MTDCIDRRAFLRHCGTLGGVLAAAAVGGCGLASGPAPRTFDLTAASGFPRSVGGSGAHIVVMTPRALPALDTEKIMVREAGGEISYYPGVQWGARLSGLVQTRLTQAFENTGRVRAIGQQGDGIAADYLIVSEIREFALDASNGPSARVALFVKVINDRSGRVAASKLFEASIPIFSDTPDGVIGALDAAFEEVQRDIVAFTFRRI